MSLRFNRRLSGVIATACILTACHQTPADVANAAADMGNGLSNAANVAVSVATPSDPGSVCAEPGTQASLKQLVAAGIAQNARAGLDGSKTLAILMMEASPDAHAGPLPSFSFAETTVDNVDQSTKKVSCTTSIVVDGSASSAHPRLSFAVQKAIDASGDIVTIPNPTQLEAATQAFIAGIQQKPHSPVENEKSSLPPPDEAAPPAASGNVQ